MAVMSLSILIAAVAVGALAAVSESASHNAAPAPGVDCMSLVLNLADCLSFVSEGSTTGKPEGTCCSGLKTVLKTDAQCLCEGFKNSAQMGVTLNVSKALSLPSACHVFAPSVSNCGLSIATGAAPAAAPVAGSPSSPAAVPSAGGAASVLAPATAPGSSGSAGSTVSAVTFLIGAVVASMY